MFPDDLERAAESVYPVFFHLARCAVVGIALEFQVLLFVAPSRDLVRDHVAGLLLFDFRVCVAIYSSRPCEFDFRVAVRAGIAVAFHHIGSG